MRTCRLIVNADDFGRSSAINRAVVTAHRDGILTSASLMVAEPAAAEAVELARAHPRLGVGLHLVLTCGRAVLPPSQIAGIANADGAFDVSAPRAGLRYFLRRSLRPQLEAEIAAQFERFHQTGLMLDHVNGHLNLHLHPVILDILVRNAARWGIRALRLTRDPFWFNARLAGGAWGYRASHAFIYWLLAAAARGKLRRAGIRFTPRVFGLLQNTRVDEVFLSRLVARLPEGDAELYSHPDEKRFRHERDALTSPRVRALIAARQIQLVRYQDLT